jgi:hypothetical protein
MGGGGFFRGKSLGAELFGGILMIIGSVIICLLG